MSKTPPSKEADSAALAERQRRALLWQRIRNVEAVLARRAADRKRARAAANDEDELDDDEPAPELPQ
jgi:hypothetical protein